MSPAIARLALFGASGDLAGRFLLPALAALEAAGRLPDGLEVVGAARRDWDDDAFRRHAGERLAQHASDVPDAARQAVIRGLRYRPVDIADAASVERVVRGRDESGRPVAAYLALPPNAFPPAARALAAGLPPGSRVAIEKPFGEDLDEARGLNALLLELFGDAAENVVFRVDHALGMPTVRRLLALRGGSGLLRALWSSRHVDQVEILWEEDLALEGRAGYYDGTGALKDVMQNHMLQVLAILAMEPPPSGDERGLRDRKTDLLKALRPPRGDEARRFTRRARYTAGRLGDRDVPSYAEEAGVDPARCTETFAEVVFHVDTPRWDGTRFLLRAGKALARRRKEAVLRFRPTGAGIDELRIGIDGPVDVRLRLTGETAADADSHALTLIGPSPEDHLPPYAHVLHDLLHGGTSLSVRGDEAVAAWQAVAPVLDAWAAGTVPLEEYPAGSAGPPPRR